MDHDEEVDGISVEFFGFPDPIAVFDDEIVMGLDAVIVTGTFMEGDSHVTQDGNERDFSSHPYIGFRPGFLRMLEISHDDVSNGVE